MEELPHYLRNDLEHAKRDSLIVRIHREEVDPGWIDGYVLSFGRQWCLLAVVDDDVHLNGLRAVRVEHISQIEVPCPHHEFKVKALALRKAKLPRIPLLNCNDSTALLRAAGANYPLITLYLEWHETDVCYVGRVVMLNKETLFLRCLNPDAEWENEPARFALDEITRIDFGGAYEEALALVAGLVEPRAPELPTPSPLH